MSVWYLELDDEITDAVARLRAAKDERVVLVVPPGSRIGTGRINFRLLAREAETRGLGLAVVSGDAQVRTLAASAGLAVYPTVSESEAAPVTVPTTTGAAAAAVPASRVITAGAVVTTADRTVPKPRLARFRSRRLGIIGGAAALVTLIGGGALYGAYVTIPRARITLVQTAHQLDQLRLTLTVDPDQATDASNGVVQGQWLAVPVSVEGTVTATGTAAPLTERARGTVTFTSHSPNPIPVPDQSVVRTTNGISFQTQGGIVVPPGESMDVPVFAEQSGVGGNVDARTITIMSDELRSTLNNGTVINKEPTTGGKSEQQVMALESDYVAALSGLTAQLDTALRQGAAAPPGLPSDGLAYPSTVLPGAVTTEPRKEVVVGQPVPTQRLVASMTGSVLTASASEIQSVAAQMLREQVPQGTVMVPNSIRVDTGAPEMADNGIVTYHATATGTAYDQGLDPDSLKARVKGMTVSAAQVILDRLGTATITLSPDFMPTLPDDPARIDLTITPLEGTPP